MSTIDTGPLDHEALPIERENTNSRKNFYTLSDEHVQYHQQVQKLYQKAEKKLPKKVVDMDFYQSLQNYVSEMDSVVPAPKNPTFTLQTNDATSSSICQRILKDLKDFDFSECMFSLEKQVFELKSTYNNTARRKPADENALPFAEAKLNRKMNEIVYNAKKFQAQTHVWTCRHNQLVRCIQQNVGIIVDQDSELERPLTEANLSQHRTLMNRFNFLNDSLVNLTEISQKKDELPIDFAKIDVGFCGKPTVIFDGNLYQRVKEAQENLSEKCSALIQKWNDLNVKGKNASKYILTAEKFILTTKIKGNSLTIMAGSVAIAYGKAVVEVSQMEMIEDEVALIDKSLNEMKLVLSQLEKYHEDLDEIFESDPIFEPSGFEAAMASREKFFSHSDEHVNFLRNLEKQYQKEENAVKETVDMDFYQSLQNCPSKVDTLDLNNFTLPSNIKDKSSISICKCILNDIQQLNLPQSLFSLEKQVFKMKKAYKEAAKKVSNEEYAQEQLNRTEQVKQDIEMAKKTFKVQKYVFRCRLNQLSQCIYENLELTFEQAGELDCTLNAGHVFQFGILLDRINFFKRSLENINQIAKRKNALKLEFNNVVEEAYQEPPAIVGTNHYHGAKETYNEILKKCKNLKTKWDELNEKRRNPSNYYSTAIFFMLVTQLKLNHLFGIIATTEMVYGDSFEKYMDQERERVHLETSFDKMKFIMEKLQQECHAAFDEIIESDPVFEPSGFDRVFI